MMRNLAYARISLGNLLPLFAIDLDLAIREQRQESSGARGRTGTRAFMAIGALLDEQHSFMHDLESFFWVLFWICIHSTGPNGIGRVVPEFESWNYMATGALATMKVGTKVLLDAMHDPAVLAEWNG